MSDLCLFVKGEVVMKKFWMLLGALTFVPQAHCLDLEEEFWVQNASSKPLHINIDNTSDISRIIEVGKKELFKRKSFSEENKMNFTIYSENDVSKSKTFEIKYPPAGTITITDVFREHLPNFIGSSS